MSFKTGQGLGYAFINFKDTKVASSALRARNADWSSQHQGLEALSKRYEKVMRGSMREEWKPQITRVEDEELTTDPELKKKIQKGEDRVKRSVRYLDNNNVEKAYDKYCSGMRYLLEVVPKLTSTSPKVRDLRMRMHDYLDLLVALAMPEPKGRTDVNDKRRKVLA